MAALEAQPVRVRLAALVLLVSACGGATPGGPVASPSPAATQSAPAAASPSSSPSGPSLELEVGALIMTGFKGQVTDAIAADFAQRGFGGLLIINLNANGSDPALVKSEIDRLRKADPNRLLVATDGEGDPICTDITSVPCLTHQPADIGRMSSALKASGFDVNLAPVSDVSTGPGSIMDSRSYGTDPAAVSTNVGAAVDAIHGAGLLATAKHFPGHGAAAGSSENAPAVVGESVATLKARDWPPFKVAIAHGVDFVMVGQLETQIDPGVPATISAPTIGALRSQLGYSGAVISDDMQMGGVTGVAPTPEGAVRFLLAGGDMVMVAHDLAVADAVDEAILAAVRSGRLPRSRVDEAYARLQALKVP